MAVKHTPGPWVRTDGYGPNPDGFAVQSVHDNYLIASCAHYYGREGTAANARLIAAAPELLDALVTLFADYKRLADSGDAGFWRLEDNEAGKQAMDAIAKATGEQP